MAAKPITCKQASFVMKDASVRLDGCCPTSTAAAQRGALHQAPHPPKPPPPLTTVQQLDPRGALLADMPTHCTPWCQNTARRGITQTTAMCYRSGHFRSQTLCLGICLDHSDADILTSNSKLVHNNKMGFMNSKKQQSLSNVDWNIAYCG